MDWADKIPDYYSDGLKVEDFKDVMIDSFAGCQAQTASGAAISLQHGSGVSITNSRAMPGTQTFLHLDKAQDRRVFVNYDLSGAAKIIAPPDQRFDTQIGITTSKRKLASSHIPTATK